jgi:Sec7-like guanine-nucleotide exchange factor
MTCHEFIDNISHTGHVYKRDLLRAVYQSIKDTPIAAADVVDTATGTVSSSASFANGNPTNAASTSSTSNTLSRAMHGAAQPIDIDADSDAQVEYKKGFVMRKQVRIEQGKKGLFEKLLKFM